MEKFDERSDESNDDSNSGSDSNSVVESKIVVLSPARAASAPTAFTPAVVHEKRNRPQFFPPTATAELHTTPEPPSGRTVGTKLFQELRKLKKLRSSAEKAKDSTATNANDAVASESNTAAHTRIPKPLAESRWAKQEEEPVEESNAAKSASSAAARQGDFAPANEPVFLSLSGNQVTPWLAPDDSGDNSFISTSEEASRLFAEDLRRLYAWLQPTAAENAMRHDVVNRLNFHVGEIFPGCRAVAFGSVVADSSLPDSDIDVVVLGNPSPNPYNVHTLRRLGQRLREAGGSVELITKARVPLVKWIDNRSGCEVDISFGMTNGPRNTQLVRRFFAEHPNLRPLLLILKLFLKQRGLNEPFTGGLGSYTVVLMLLSFFQLGQPVHYERPPQYSMATGLDWMYLSRTLVQFFHFYGKLFNFETVGIDVRDGGSYFGKMSRGFYYSGSPTLCICDPDDPSNDVAKSSFNMLQVRSSFESAYHFVAPSAGHQSTAAAFIRATARLGLIFAPVDSLVERRAEIERAYGYTSLVSSNSLLQSGATAAATQTKRKSFVVEEGSSDEEELPIPDGNGSFVKKKKKKKKRKK